MKAFTRPPSSPTLREVMAADLCSGCGMCAGISHGAVVMAESPGGYLRPHQLADLSDTNEALVDAACPGRRVAKWPTSPVPHPFWGAILSCQTAHANDAATRHIASSGGALSAIAIVALKRGLVDAVVHIAPCPEHPTRNVTTVSTTAAEVVAGAGSRYAPSSPLEDIADLVASGRRHLFIGKPCDVSALSLLAEADETVAQAFPFRLSFFCGGIPSFAGADDILSAMGMQERRLDTFRYRGMGWPGLTTAIAHNGDVARMAYADSWGRFLSTRIQYRCKICPDSVGGAADLVAADAWYGGESGYPQFEERDGRSLVLARTAAGQALLAAAIADGAISTAPLDIAEIDLMQPAQARRKRLVAARVAAARTLAQGVPDFSGVAVWQASKRARWSEKLRNYLGSLRRILMRQK